MIIYPLLNIMVVNYMTAKYQYTFNVGDDLLRGLTYNILSV